MIHFENDYNRGCAPQVLEALAADNGAAHAGYGADEACEQAAQAIRAACGAPHAAVHFLVGGTQANVTMLDHLLRPWEGVLCADTGHINVHETGALEHLGHKCLPLAADAGGKVSAAQVEEAARAFEESPIPEHVAAPGAVYVSQPTELGGAYSEAEMRALAQACRAHGLPLVVDGARLGYALAVPGAAGLACLAECADAFTVGGTKCGALFGEAVVFPRPATAPRFRSSMKQNGGLLAKGWLLGVQFRALFADGLYGRLCARAVEGAAQVRQAFAARGVGAAHESPTNQQFFLLSDAQLAALEDRFVLDVEGRDGRGRNLVRVCVAWSTEPAELSCLLDAIAALPGAAA